MSAVRAAMLAGSLAVALVASLLFVAPAQAQSTPSLDVEVTADPTYRYVPGGDFTFSVEVTNAGEGSVTITSLTDDVYGDLSDPDNPDVANNTCAGAVGTELAPEATFTCSFDGEFTGEHGDTQTNVVTATAEDASGQEATADDDATVGVGELVPPTISVDKTADPESLAEPGGTFTFTVEVTNTSQDIDFGDVTITSLTDDIYGDLSDPDNPEVANNTCVGAVGTALEPDESFTCSFEGEFTGEAGDTQTDVVTAVAENTFGQEATDDDDATVTITAPPGVCEGVTAPEYVDRDQVRSAHLDNVDCILGLGISVGGDDDPLAYHPLNEVTRAQLATFVANVLDEAGVSLPDGSGAEFNDTDGNVHEGNILRLAEAGIVSGTGQGGFSPAADVSRDQMASVMTQAAEHALDEANPGDAPHDLSVETGPFDDIAGNVHAGNINGGYEAGLFLGTSATTFSPDNDVLRDQMASFLINLLQYTIDI